MSTNLNTTEEAVTFADTASIISEQLKVATAMLDRLKKEGNTLVTLARKAAATKEANGVIEDINEDEEFNNIQQISYDMDNMKEQLNLVIRKLKAYAKLNRRY